MNQASYGNRQEAGVQLARLLHEYQSDPNTIAICISRQGIPVAVKLAQHLNIKLDILAVREFVVPGTNEKSSGAVTSDGDIHLILDKDHSAKKYRKLLEDMCRLERKRLLKQENIFRHGHTKLSPANKNVIIVDDGSQGSSALISAIRTIKKQQPKSLLVAIPVASRKTIAVMQQRADRIFCLKVPECIEDINQEYRSGNHLDDISYQHMLWDFWDNTRRPLLRLQSHSPSARRPEPVHSEVISRNTWDRFTRDFSQRFVGWNLSIKVIHFRGHYKYHSTKPFRCHSFIRHNPFFGISYLRDKNLCIVRYIDNGKVKCWRIKNPTSLVLRDNGEQRKSLRIDNEKEQTFYIQLINQGNRSVKSTENPTASAESTSRGNPTKLALKKMDKPVQATGRA